MDLPSNRKLLSTREMQCELLNILAFFDGYCTKNGWKYSLWAGTLLGAVRHQGFIPWDDDLDVCMPRPDFNMLISAAYDIDRFSDYRIVGFPEGDLGKALFVKVVSKKIGAWDKYSNRMQNLWLDVFPDDGLPSDDRENRKIFQKAMVLRRAIMMGHANPNEGKSALHRALKRAYQLVDFNSTITKWSERKLDQLARRIPYDESDFVGTITWGTYGAGHRCVKKDYEQRVLLPFEGKYYSAMACWDAFLTGIYGDYMKLPPKEQRVAHGLEAWFLDDEGMVGQKA